MSILDRYIVRAILGSVLLVLAVFVVLGGLFAFISQQGNIGVGHYTLLDALWFTLLNVPEQAYQLLPITTVIGSLIGLGALARGSEITVIRATGVSVRRLAGAALIGALILIGAEAVVGEFVAPQLQEAASQQRAFSQYNTISFGGGTGAWARDGDLILNVSRQSGSRRFGGMQVFELSPTHQLLAIGHATRATAAGGDRWLLDHYTASHFSGDEVTVRPSGPKVLHSNISASFLGFAVQDPAQMTLRSLWQLIGYYRANSIDASQYVFAFWSRIARTVAIVFSVLLAVPLVLGSMRSAGAGARTMLGLGIGIAFFLLQRLIESGTIVFHLNPVILAWLPTVLFATVTMLLFASAR
jgi:lipopolysaccharide export system permease protein